MTQSDKDKIILLIAGLMLKAYGEEKHLPPELVAERLKVGMAGRPELDKAVTALKDLLTVAARTKVPPGLEIDEWRKRQKG